MNNNVACLSLFHLDQPTFGILRYIQQALIETIPEANVETGKDTMDMHIRMPQGYGVHLLFTWIGAWDSGDRPKGIILLIKFCYIHQSNTYLFISYRKL